MSPRGSSQLLSGPPLHRFLILLFHLLLSSNQFVTKPVGQVSSVWLLPLFLSSPLFTIAADNPLPTDTTLTSNPEMWTRVTWLGHFMTWYLTWQKETTTCQSTLTWAFMTGDFTWTSYVSRDSVCHLAHKVGLSVLHIGVLQVFWLLFCLHRSCSRKSQLSQAGHKARHSPLSCGIYLANVITRHSQQTKARTLNRNVTAAYT